MCKSWQHAPAPHCGETRAPWRDASCHLRQMTALRCTGHSLSRCDSAELEAPTSPPPGARAGTEVRRGVSAPAMRMFPAGDRHVHRGDHPIRPRALSRTHAVSRWGCVVSAINRTTDVSDPGEARRELEAGSKRGFLHVCGRRAAAQCPGCVGGAWEPRAVEAVTARGWRCTPAKTTFPTRAGGGRPDGSWKHVQNFFCHVSGRYAAGRCPGCVGERGRAGKVCSLTPDSRPSDGWR